MSRWSCWGVALVVLAPYPNLRFRRSKSFSRFHDPCTHENKIPDENNYFLSFDKTISLRRVTRQFLKLVHVLLLFPAYVFANFSFLVHPFFVLYTCIQAGTLSPGSEKYFREGD